MWDCVSTMNYPKLFLDATAFQRMLLYPLLVLQERSWHMIYHLGESWTKNIDFLIADSTTLRRCDASLLHLDGMARMSRDWVMGALTRHPVLDLLSFSPRFPSAMPKSLLVNLSLKGYSLATAAGMRQGVMQCT